MAKYKIRLTNDIGATYMLSGVDEGGRTALEEAQFRSTGSVVVHDDRGRHDIACSRIHDVRIVG